MMTRAANYWKLHRFPILMVIASLILYLAFAYDLQRTEFTKLILLYFGLFFLCFKTDSVRKWNFKFLLVAGILFPVDFPRCRTQPFPGFLTALYGTDS